jgi:hypothetical protein
MPNITTCTKCGGLYEAGSEEQANEPERFCPSCRKPTAADGKGPLCSRDLLPNKQQSYDRLGSIVSDARLAGLIDWNGIEDRTRETKVPSTWDSPEQILRAAASSFRYACWDDQPWHVEVWIEKEALAGVIEGICSELRIPHLACRGYTSQSEMWSSAQRLVRACAGGDRRALILHLGDHDPSGLDMTRDIADRLEMFGAEVEVRRIALNMDQIEEFKPPPNPAKVTDSRFADYQAKFGDESWELDALEPKFLTSLIQDAVFEVRDVDLWKKAVRREDADRRKLDLVAEQWAKVTRGLK